jgi:hemerythrin-like domain-containing protein
MTQSLPTVAHEHHERILAVVDRLPELADALLPPGGEGVGDRIASTGAFLGGTLLPHIEAAEQTLYPELERMLQNRHSMSPMRREHQEIRLLVGTYDKLAGEFHKGKVDLGHNLATRRVIFQLFALLKIHLAEEEAYLHIIQHGSSAQMLDVMAAGLEHPILVEREATAAH